MDLILAFTLFIVSMILSLFLGLSMLIPLGVGLAAFALVALRRGHSLKAVMRMALRGAWKSRVVVIVLLLIGCLTSLWRQSGTIAYFTDYGIRLVPPKIFILAAFLLTTVASYALGTSFGVAGTIGVILMTIARASGISAVLAGGAIMSGLYVGDRASPASSCANLVAVQTNTDLSRNIRLMIGPSLMPIGACVLLYGALSALNAPTGVDTSLLTKFEEEFSLSLWCLVPTALLLALAFSGMNIKLVMVIDIAVSMVMTVILQQVSVPDMLRMTITGFAPKNAELAPILAGGGIKSMVSVTCILLLSNACTGIFDGTRMLSGVESALESIARRCGRFAAMIVASLAACAIFCNQTIGVIMCSQCMGGCYGDSDAEREMFMLDIANSVVTLAGVVPWCIACSVPLTTLGTDFRSVLVAVFLYLVPLGWYFRLRRKHMLHKMPQAEKEGQS